TAPTLDYEGVLEVELVEDRIEVVAQGGRTLVPTLLRDLEAAGHEVTAVDIRRASLEEVFVDMTRTEGAVQR
ncbi:MAG: ABC transporter ATP-binding protein, partial [Haloarculaceae archaeon]